MEPFTRLTAVAAPLLRPNIDTDAIIPSREMKRVSKKGLADGLFAGWRYESPSSRNENADFILNQQPYRSARILLGGENFGCGSSREHAVWALHEWGIRAIVAPSFGAIFRANCIRNGVLPIGLEHASVRQLADWVSVDPEQNVITINLSTRLLSAGGNLSWHFEIDDQDQRMLLEGLDAIDLTLTHRKQIDDFEARDTALRPWIHE